MIFRNLLPLRRQSSCCSPARQRDESALRAAQPASQLAREVDDFFAAFASDFATPWYMPSRTTRAAAVNVRDNEREYVIEAEMPGLTDKDITVSVERGVLHLTGERQVDSDSKDGAVHLHRRFARALTLPDNCKTEEIVAQLRHGVLTVTIPKAPKVDTSKRIPVVAG